MRASPPAPQARAWTGRRAARGAEGFSLIEVVIVLTILAVLAAAAVPTLKGMQNVEKVRAPLAELQRLAKEARLRAMQEKRSYQVALTSTGFTASRYFDPYLNFAELAEFNTAVEQGVPVSGSVPTIQVDSTPSVQLATGSDLPAGEGAPRGPLAAAPPAAKEWTQTYKLPEGMTMTVQFWHESVPTPIAGEIIKLWVFQSNGMCEPLKVQFTAEKADLSGEFSALTADIVHEKSDYR